MTAGFVPPGHWEEAAAELRVALTCTLDANGNGVVTFTPDHANQRWVVTTVIVSTSQPASASLVPYATGALNTTSLAQMSPGNQRGTTYNGNSDTFGPPGFDVGPCDFYSVLWYPPPGQSGASMAGYTATAVLKGTKYTRRALWRR